MGQFLDSVPFSGIIRIRDMMYSVKDPFRLDQGDVSFDAPDTVKRRHAPRDRREPQPLRPDDGRAAAARTACRQTSRVNGIPIGAPDEVMVTTGGIHALYILSGAARAGRRGHHPEPEWPPPRATSCCAHGVVVPCPLHENSAGATTSTSWSRRSRRRRERSTSTRRTTRPAEC